MTVALTTEGYVVSNVEGGVSYRMRGYDSISMTMVYWSSSTVDDTGASYPGPGTPSDIVVTAVTGK